MAQLVYAAILAASVLLGDPPHGQGFQSSSPTPGIAKAQPIDGLVVEGKTALVVQELPVTIHAPSGGVFYLWRYPDALTVRESGESIELTAGPAGQHRVACTRVAIDWDKRSTSQTVHVVDLIVGAPIPPPIPGPAPGPLPVPPTPGPTPTPKPPAPAPPADEFSQWIAAIPAAAYTRAGALGVADAYEAVAAQCAATPGNWDRDKLVAATKIRNVTALGADKIDQWRDPFFVPLAEWQGSRKIGPRDMAAHVELWRETAARIRQAAQTRE